MTALIPLVEDTIWTVPQHQSFMGVHVGTRMTVVKLPSGGLFLHSPVDLKPELRAALDEIGPVTQIVAPNMYHHLYAGNYKIAYPEAVLHATDGLQKKRKDLPIDCVLTEMGAPHSGFEDALEPIYLGGTLMKETVFFHTASKTLISCDLVENFESSDHLPTRLYLKSGGIKGKPGLHRLFKLAFRDKKAARVAVDRILEWDFDQVVIAHGDLITENAKDIVRETYSFLK